MTSTVGNSVYASLYTGIDPSGATDSRSGLINAMAAVAGTGMTLVIDCPIKISIGSDYTKPVFVRSGTNLSFTPTGRFIMDNAFMAGFVFLNTTDCEWINPWFDYRGTPPVDCSVAPYVTAYSNFNDVTMKNDMHTTFGNTFSGSGSCYFTGYTNPVALIRIQGAASRLTFVNARLTVPQTATNLNYCSVFCSIDQNWIPGTSIANNSQPMTATVGVNPTDINFLGGSLDGYCMGFVGTGGVKITNFKFLRYSDIQNSSGSQMGGVSPTGSGVWLSPPHPIYLIDPTPDFSPYSGKELREIFDAGIYVGGRTMRTFGLTSLKISPTFNTIVDGYTSLRPHGGVTILCSNAGSQYGIMRNLNFVFDSSIPNVDGSVNIGITFPSANPYNFMVMSNVTVRDANPNPTQFPISDISNLNNANCCFENFSVYLLNFSGTNPPSFAMSGNNMALTAKYFFNTYSATQTYRGVYQQQGTETITNSSVTIEVFGFRLIAITFTAALASNATGGTLATAWAYPTGVYMIQFSDNEMMWASFTNGGTTVSWGTYGSGLNAAVNASATVQNVLASGSGGTSNYTSYRNRIVTMQNGVGIGNRIRILDVTNGLEQTVKNGVQRETWSQMWYGGPVGPSYALPLFVPPTHAVTEFSVLAQGVGTVPSFGLGWSGSPTALASAVAASNGNPGTAFPIPYAASAGKQLLLTPTSGSFDGSGNVIVSVTCETMFAAG